MGEPVTESVGARSRRPAEIVCVVELDVLLQTVSCTCARITEQTEEERRSPQEGAQATSLRYFLLRSRLCCSLEIPVARPALELDLLTPNRIPHGLDVPRNTATETVQHVGETAAVNLPGGRNISVPRGSINYELAAFLADPSGGPLPKTFVFDNLNVQAASTQLAPQSTATVNNLAEVLKAYPNARVELAGHTDNTGTADANQTLSLNRANAVKALLVNEGVNADSISTNGYGQTRPVAPNDTDEGRERNRRLELNVINR